MMSMLLLFRYYLHLEESVAFLWSKLESLSFNNDLFLSLFEIDPVIMGIKNMTFDNKHSSPNWVLSLGELILFYADIIS